MIRITCSTIWLKLKALKNPRLSIRGEAQPFQKSLMPELNEAGIQVLEDTHPNQQRATINRYGSVRMLACCIRRRRR
jgi:hypothetical protein